MGSSPQDYQSPRRRSLHFLMSDRGGEESQPTYPMGTMELSDLTLENLLPHRGAMLLIGSVLEVDAMHAVTLSTVQHTWPMADRQGVPPLICVELAAQTAGVCNGWDRIQTQGLDSNQMGWLVAIKRAEFFIDRLWLDSIIRARAENTLIFDKFREVTSQLYHNDQLIAEVVLQLYQV